MKKYLLLPFVILLILLSAGGCRYYHLNDSAPNSHTIALLPLDSRPCNTQYPQVLAQAAGYTLLTPDETILDDFLTPSDNDALWQWLENTAVQCENIIIFTNQLFNGGLINSRNSESYETTQQQIERLTTFCQGHDNNIMVVTILPRQKPSQFDKKLWDYEVALCQWSADFDQLLLQNPDTALPAAKDIPDDILKQYLAVFENSCQITETLAQLAKDGYIDHYFVGQDDGEQWGIANTIARQLENRRQDNLTLLHGADELTMLLCARIINQGEPTAVNLLYTTPEKLSTYYPYEAADLATIIEEKLALANLVLDKQAPYTIIVQTAPEDSQQTLDLIAKDNSQYLAVADIAYTNKGDFALYPALSQKETLDTIDCIAGWNTAGNTLGTVFAHCRITDAISQNYRWLSSQNKRQTISALHTFKYIRLAEDYVYQAALSNELRGDLQNWDWMDFTNAFRPNRKEDAQAILDQRFETQRQLLNELFNGKHTLQFNNHTIHYTVDNFSGTITFPWNRAFEVKADCAFTLQLN